MSDQEALSQYLICLSQQNGKTIEVQHRTVNVECTTAMSNGRGYRGQVTSGSFPTATLVLAFGCRMESSTYIATAYFEMAGTSGTVYVNASEPGIYPVRLVAFYI